MRTANYVASTFSPGLYPNPFNARLTIKVNVFRASKVTITIYNIIGELVKSVTENEIITAAKNYFSNTSDSREILITF